VSQAALVFYGSWSLCQSCGSLDFNDTYFSHRLYEMKETSHSPEALAAHRRIVPHDPVVHGPGEVGVSSRWWYLPGMYKPVVSKCHCCDGPAHTAEDDKDIPGKRLNDSMEKDHAKFAAQSADIPHIHKTSDLYRIPTVSSRPSDAAVNITWPRMDIQSKVFEKSLKGPCFLDFTDEEQKALAIIILVTNAKQESKQPRHWKKTGLSYAYFKRDLVHRDAMPTARCKAAFDYLTVGFGKPKADRPIVNNQYYIEFLEKQRDRLRDGSALSISSYDLFITFTGVECAIYPALYPRGEMSDTGLRAEYTHKSGDISPPHGYGKNK